MYIYNMLCRQNGEIVVFTVQFFRQNFKGHFAIVTSSPETSVAIWVNGNSLHGWCLKLKSKSRPLSGHLSPIHNTLPSNATLLSYASELWPMKQCLWVMVANMCDAQSYWGARSATLYEPVIRIHCVNLCMRPHSSTL